MRSKTIRGGSEMSIDFAPGTDMHRAETLDLEPDRRPARPRCRPNMDLTVEQMTPSVFPIISRGADRRRQPAQLRDYAFYSWPR